MKANEWYQALDKEDKLQVDIQIVELLEEMTEQQAIEQAFNDRQRWWHI